ncbi:MAG: hypothetical protein Q9202_000558 [Teloschistes flavicans]
MESGQGSSPAPTHPPNDGNGQRSAQASLEWHVELYTWDKGPKKGTQERAVRHEQIRAELLDAALSTGLEWTHPQPEGEGQLDVTAPWPEPRDQRDWGFDDRAHYPPIIFQLEKYPGQDPDYEVTTWYHRGLLVLDMEGRPMRKLPHLPDIISSRIPGGHIEALLRTHSATEYQDIRGRMPTLVWNRLGMRVPLQSKGALTKLASVFRETAGCLNWTNRRGSGNLNQYVLENLPPHLRAMNTTRGWRNLTDADRAIIRNSGIGSRPENSRHASGSAEAKKKRAQYLEKQITAAAEALARPRPQEDMGDYVYEDEQRYLDSRNARPSDLEEEVLRQALVPTIEHLQAIVGEDFEPMLYAFLPYNQQLRALQVQLDDRYRELNGDAARAPTLVHLTRWGGGILNWRTARFWDANATSLYLVGENGSIGPRIREDDPEYVQWSNEAAQRAEREDSDEDEVLSRTDDEPADGLPRSGAYLVDSEGNPIPLTATFRESASPPSHHSSSTQHLDSSSDDVHIDPPTFARSPTTLDLSQYELAEPTVAGASADGGEEVMGEDESDTAALEATAAQSEQEPRDSFMGFMGDDAEDPYHLRDWYLGD